MTTTAQELTSRGVALAKEKRLREAVQCFEEALRLDPQFALAHRNLGFARELQGDMAGAIACYRQVLAIDPTTFDVLKRLGETLFNTGAIRQAAECFQAACALAPTNGTPFNDLGVALAKLNRHREAVEAFRRATALDPENPVTTNGLGAALTSIHELEEAEKWLLKAQQLAPTDPSTQSNLGILYKQLGRLDDALRHYDRALALKPDYPEAQKARAICLLLKGDLLAGWPGYEWREKMGDLRVTHSAPRWTGDRLEGRTLLIETEQGLGDTIQFIRYTAEIKQRHRCRIVVACEAPLVPLLKSAPGIDLLISQKQSRPPFHVWAPLLSLPGILQTTFDTIPASVPYLQADPARIEQWSARLASLSGFRIGIAWQGNKDNQQNPVRSFPLRSFAPIAGIPGVSLISLQKGTGTEELDACQFPVHTLGEDFDAAGGAFLDTAAVMKSLNLVISADTSVVHVAGALAAEVWVPLPFVPDWRWSLQGERTPWYPTMRLFRQAARGQWQPVFENIAAAVRRLVSG
jgi:Flp pilus assembly protein TadD